MKKIMIVTMILAFCMLSSNAFAATLSSGDVTTGGGIELTATAPATSSIARLSNNVNMGAQFSGTGYALTTYHTSGTKMYGTAYDSTALFFLDIGVGGTFVAPTSSASDEAFEFSGTTWTKM